MRGSRRNGTDSRVLGWCRVSFKVAEEGAYTRTCLQAFLLVAHLGRCPGGSIVKQSPGKKKRAVLRG